MKTVEHKKSFAIDVRKYPEVFLYVKERAIREGRGSLAETCNVIFRDKVFNHTRTPQESQEKTESPTARPAVG